MRKASQDGGDNTSVTSGIENEIKKPGAGILKSTRNSIKRKVQHFSTESDDTANEPLLHKNKEKPEVEKQSAKILISKTKTDFVGDRGDDRDKLLADDNITKPSISDVTRITRDATNGNGLKDQKVSQPITTSSIHNHMNTNVFNDPERTSNSIIPNAQILVELDVSKPSESRFSPSPLIFTTAKIHTDGTKQHMEPVHVTPVPILSTIEGGIVKTDTKQTDSEILTANNDIKEITKNGILQQIKEKGLVEQGNKFPNLIEKVNIPTSQNIPLVSSNEKPQRRSSIKGKNDVKDINVLENPDSDVSNSTIANKILKNETLSYKGSSDLSDNKVIEGKLRGSIKANTLNRISNTVSSSSEVNAIKKGPSFHGSPSFDKSHVDINKNIQSPSSYKPFNNISSSKEKHAEVSPSSVIDNTDNIDRTDSRIKTSENLNKSYGFRNEIPSKEITESNFPEKSSTMSVSDSSKSKSTDKTPLTKSPEVAQSTIPAKTQSPNVSDVNSAIFKNTNSTSIVTSTISSPSAHSSATRTKTTDSSKISTPPKSRDLKYSTNQDKLSENYLKSVPSVQLIDKITSASKSTSNSTVTVVSSITKAKPTAANIKMPDGSTSGMISVSSSTKQSASPSTIRTVFSAKPSMKSSSLSAVSSVKTNLRSALNEGDKLKSNVKSNTSVSTSSATAGSVAGAQTLSSTKPTISSTLTKAQKNAIDNGSKISEPVKDNKGSKVDK